MSDLSIRLVICTEFGPVGPRLERGEPLPPHQQSYENTPEGLAQAKHDMGRIAEYIARHKERKTRNLRRK